MEFEALIMRYEAEPNVDALSDAIKKAVLVRGCPEPLKTHLKMNLQTYVGYGSIRKAEQSYTEAKRTWMSEAALASSSTDMEVDVVCKDGSKGKSKCGKRKSKNPKGDECYIWGKRGHVQKDCWYKDTRGERGKGKIKGKGKQKSKGKDKDKPVNEVSQEDSESSNNSQIVANFTSDWIFAVTWADNLEEICESEVEILLDSGAYDHVCSPEFARASNASESSLGRRTRKRKRDERTRCRQREPSHSEGTDGCSDSKTCERASTTNREGTK